MRLWRKLLKVTEKRKASSAKPPVPVPEDESMVRDYLVELWPQSRPARPLLRLIIL